MFQIVEEYATKKVQQRDIETATELLKNGVSVDIIVNSIPSLTREFILDLSKKWNHRV